MEKKIAPSLVISRQAINVKKRMALLAAQSDFSLEWSSLIALRSLWWQKADPSLRSG
jgi:hypothetical protein